MILASFGISSCTTSQLLDKRFKVRECAKDERTFTLGTYNIYGDRNPSEVRTVIAALNDLDALLVQEVDLAVEQKGLLTMAQCDALVGRFTIDQRPFLFPHATFASLNATTAEPPLHFEGLAIFSAHPIESSYLLDLEESGSKDRQALCAVLDVDGTKVLVINTDHEVGIPSPGPNARSLQVESLVDHLSSATMNADYVIVGGDFNTGGSTFWPFGVSSSREVAILDEKMGKHGLSPLPKEARMQSTFSKWHFIHRSLDHLYFRGCEVTEWGLLAMPSASDHSFLWARTALKPVH